MRLLILLIMLGAMAPSILYTQNNRMSMQTGLFHCFFDGSSLMNTKHMSKDRGIFNGLLYNSVGIQYQRMINPKSSISTEAMYFYEYYWNVHPNMTNKVVTRRTYMTYNINYDRYIDLTHNLNFTYGGGINYRHGSDMVVVNYSLLDGDGSYKSLVESRLHRDIGINARVGIEYSPLKWLTLYTKFDLLGFVYTHDKEQIRKLKDVYEVPNYPNRFDLSWRFGLGFNFGK
jgi:hypothetical protein